MRTRALENEIFVCGVNPSYTYHTYQSDGHSMLVNPDGQILQEMNESPGLCETEIDLSQISKLRWRMPFYEIRRSDLYELKEKKK